MFHPHLFRAFDQDSILEPGVVIMFARKCNDLAYCLGRVFVSRGKDDMFHRKTSLACRFGNQGSAFSPCNQVIYALGGLLPNPAMDTALPGHAQSLAHSTHRAAQQCTPPAS